MKVNAPRYISLQFFKEEPLEFNLVVLDKLDEIEFTANRLYFLKSESIAVQRGNHAHLNQDQILCLVQGAASVTLYNEKGEEMMFSLAEKAVFIPEKHWIELNIEANSTVLCLATSSFEKAITIKQKDKFFI